MWWGLKFASEKPIYLRGQPCFSTLFFQQQQIKCREDGDYSTPPDSHMAWHGLSLCWTFVFQAITLRNYAMFFFFFFSLLWLLLKSRHSCASLPNCAAGTNDQVKKDAGTDASPRCAGKHRDWFHNSSCALLIARAVPPCRRDPH